MAAEHTEIMTFSGCGGRLKENAHRRLRCSAEQTVHCNAASKERCSAEQMAHCNAASKKRCNVAQVVHYSVALTERCRRNVRHTCSRPGSQGNCFEVTGSRVGC
jgi:hypothetical protein